MRRSYLIIVALLLSAISVIAQEKVYTASELKGFLKEQLADAKAIGPAEGEQLNMKGMAYSSASRNYKVGPSTIQVLIADYSEAMGIYQAATSLWQSGMEYENEEQTARSIQLMGAPGWETYTKEDGKAEVIIGMNDHLLMTIEMEPAENTERCKKIALQLISAIKN